MSNMILKVEFLIGTDLKDAIQEAKNKCVIMNLCYVCFEFNDKLFSVSQNADVEDLYDKFMDKNYPSKHIVG